MILIVRKEVTLRCNFFKKRCFLMLCISKQRQRQLVAKRTLKGYKVPDHTLQHEGYNQIDNFTIIAYLITGVQYVLGSSEMVKNHLIRL